MVRRLILHIGTPKTGSTSIQECLARLDTPGFRYARLSGPINHSAALHSIFTTRPDGNYAMRRVGRSQRYMDKSRAVWTKEFASELDRPEDTLIISGEGICHFDEAGVEAVIHRVAASGRQLQVYGMARDPASFAASMLQENLKTNHARPTEPPRPAYRIRFKHWVDRLDPAQIRIDRFDPDTFVNGSAVQTMARTMSIPDLPIETRFLNPGMNQPVTHLAYRFNMAHPGSTGTMRKVHTRNRFIRLLRDTLPGPRFAPPIEAMTYDDSFAEDVAWLAQAVGIDFTGQLDRLRPKMIGRPLGALLSSVSPDTTAALAKLVVDQGISRARFATIDDDLCALYDHLLTHGYARSALAEKKQRLGARLRRRGLLPPRPRSRISRTAPTGS